MRRRIATAFLLGALFLSCCACTASPAQRAVPQRAFSITVFALGKADAILVESGSHAMLIDCGEKEHGARLLRELEARGIERLDYLQITHFDKDHMGGAAALVGGTEIGTVLFPDYEGRRAEYFSLMKLLASHPGAVAVTGPLELTLGEDPFTVFPAEDPAAFDREADDFDNEMSLVTLLQSGGKRFLFCGDAEKGRIRRMLGSGTDWSCDWIKLPHHGRYGKQLARLLKQCGAEAAVITDSADEPADAKTLALLAELGIESFETRAGTVVTTLDGGAIRIEITEEGKGT